MKDFKLYNPLLRKKCTVTRILGQHTQGRPGPLLIVLAGIHGNEPSGVFGFQSVLQQLQQSDPNFSGTLVGIAGNLAALKAEQRFLHEDLNRIWMNDRINTFSENSKSKISEENDLREILHIIENHRHPKGRNYFLDCHSTSSESIPYISVPSDAPSVQLAGEIPVHSVIGGGDKLTGVSDRYLIDNGFCGFTFEAGRHHRLSSIEAQEAAIWVTLHRTGCLTEEPHHAEECLARTQIDGHKYYEFEYIHKITPERGFRMKPGYCNFQRIHQDDLLAWEEEKPIVSKWDARIYLPLYQSQGDDGFSIIRETN